MSFIREVIEWYNIHKRDLPWRKTTDPYIIWLSEVILQQTRVDQGLPYFYRFAEKYPEVSDFASASEDEILNLWQGLGYYSRGRNMHRTAQIVMEDHAGYFPKTYDELIKLKGIGEYTAAAISSFAANEVKAVVDGNVFRVLARYFGIAEPINTSKAKKTFTKIANEVIDDANPALSNQALMEFGSLQCKPKKPLCSNCPLQNSCHAYKYNLTDTLPVKLKKTAVRNRYFNYIVFIKDEKILMNKRGPNDIWQNLHEFPLIETEDLKNASDIVTDGEFQKHFGSVEIKSVEGPIKHLLSHQKIHAQFIIIDKVKKGINFADNNWFYTDFSTLDKLAQPKLIFAFLKKFLP
ncbi:A/G-specific adenine glycosylase [Pedobacter sp. P351]|uniref:A/G-specific adenine glycosylase n=1 Tax=Pedobacter superstes TaxID=3133441 RepID=UPI0030A73CD6